jgi:hypothetical protein
MKLPYCFEDMTLSQFMKLHELEQEKCINVNDDLFELNKRIKKLSILSGETEDYISKLSGKEFKKYLSKVS